jgi:hypothetical protein
MLIEGTRLRRTDMSRYNEANAMSSSSSPTSRYASVSSGWAGWIAFASVMMFMLGAFHIIQGLVALFKDEYYLVGHSGLVVNVDYTAWGWVHLIWGVIVVFAGAGVLAGRIWARTVGVLIALVSAIVNLAFLAAYPIWSLIMIALCIIVIMALTVHGSDVAAEDKY